MYKQAQILYAHEIEIPLALCQNDMDSAEGVSESDSRSFDCKFYGLFCLTMSIVYDIKKVLPKIAKPSGSRHQFNYTYGCHIGEGWGVKKR